MKTASKLTSFFLIFCFFNAAFAFENNLGSAIRFETFIESETFLVRHIITNAKGVYLQIGNTWLATEGIQATGEGICVLVNGEWITIAEALENPECARATWKCPVCGFNNYDGISACGVCGTPRNG